MKINDIVSFNKESFFNGAVQTEWFYDNKKVENIAESYVFHAKVNDYVISKQGMVVPKIRGRPKNARKVLAICRQKQYFCVVKTCLLCRR